MRAGAGSPPAPLGEAGESMGEVCRAPVRCAAYDQSMLRGDQVQLRPLARDDLEALDRINREPAVARWWRPAEFESWPLDDDVERFTIAVGGEVAGLIQCEEESDPDFRHAGIDLFLTARLHGRGLGAEAIRVLARHLFDDRGHHRLVIDPAVSNTTAIRSYERVGFRPVGIMRRYQRDPASGEWRDNLLMDMLTEELERG
jgi:aminoglycoside 6'-N-acetyltransferase